MCGIVGQLRFDGSPVDRALVKRMTAHLRRRGPDGKGFHFERCIGMGHRRLALVDPSGPGQPVSNEDGSLWLVGNNEIYNHLELRRELENLGHQFQTAGDAEVILHLFEEIGEAAFERIVGMFAFALWDVLNETLYLVRDPFGIKPLHYTRGSMGTFLFASELGALLCDKSIDRSINPVAVDGYLRSLTVPEPHCIIRSVHKVPAGHFVRRTREGVETHRYFELEIGRGRTMQQEELADQLRAALKETVSMSLRGDTEVGCFLSGGVDSSALVATASQIVDGPLRTYSLGFEEKSFDESPYSQLVSQTFKSRHCEIRLSRNQAVDVTARIIDCLDEPFADSSALPTFVLAERAAQDVKAVLSGEGLDELFAGNAWHLPLKGTLTAEQNDDPLDDPRRNIFSRETLAELCQSSHRQILAHKQNGNLAPARQWGAIFAKNPIDKRLAFDLGSYLPSDMLVKMDRLPMVSSLEVRVPYLNAPFAGLVAGMNLSMKIRENVQKYLMKTILRGVVPDVVLDRPKQGFAIPIDIWIWQDGRFRDMVYDVLSDSQTRQRGLFNTAAIQTMLDQHDRFEQLHGHRLWTLFMFEMWYRRISDISNRQDVVSKHE
ncbi:MAG: asparagine synthase (glutamine-hydrolyzing) [Planctomycetaceae bacterium]|nr:asparagine synthase (glutamine-hydrolyzing) [Planctomycetaceae bacterium]